MSPKRTRSEAAEPDSEDSSSTDPEMLLLESVGSVAKQEVRMSWIPPAPTQAEVEAMGNLTMEGLFDLTERHPSVMRGVSRYMLYRHGVWIGPRIDKANGSLTMSWSEKRPAIKRRCKWDGLCWSLSETLSWTLRHGATLLWTLKYWERDYEAV